MHFENSGKRCWHVIHNLCEFHLFYVFLTGQMTWKKSLKKALLCYQSLPIFTGTPFSFFILNCSFFSSSFSALSSCSACFWDSLLGWLWGCCFSWSFWSFLSWSWLSLFSLLSLFWSSFLSWSFFWSLSLSSFLSLSWLSFLYLFYCSCFFSIC